MSIETQKLRNALQCDINSGAHKGVLHSASYFEHLHTIRNMISVQLCFDTETITRFLQKLTDYKTVNKQIGTRRATNIMEQAGSDLTPMGYFDIFRCQPLGYSCHQMRCEVVKGVNILHNRIFVSLKGYHCLRKSLTRLFSIAY